MPAANMEDWFGVPSEWTPTDDIAAAWNQDNQRTRRKLNKLAQAGEIERDPPIDQDAQGKTVRWRKRGLQLVA